MDFLTAVNVNHHHHHNHHDLYYMQNSPLQYHTSNAAYAYPSAAETNFNYHTNAGAQSAYLTTQQIYHTNHHQHPNMYDYGANSSVYSLPTQSYSNSLSKSVFSYTDQQPQLHHSQVDSQSQQPFNMPFNMTANTTATATEQVAHVSRKRKISVETPHEGWLLLYKSCLF